MNPELLSELKIKTRKVSLRHRISSSNNSTDYIELNNIDLEKNEDSINADDDFPPPPPSLIEISEDYNHDINNLNSKINKKLCCFGILLLSLVAGMGAIYKFYIL
jgi:hypothetical protein